MPNSPRFISLMYDPQKISSSEVQSQNISDVGVHQVSECNVCIARAQRCRTGTRHSAHQSCKPHLSANLQHMQLALAPQVEFELLKGMQQQNTSQIRQTRHQVVCIVFEEIVQLNFMILDSCKNPQQVQSVFYIEYLAQQGLKMFLQFDCSSSLTVSKHARVPQMEIEDIVRMERP